MERGFSINIIPIDGEDGSYRIDLFAETWQFGALAGITMVERFTVEFDPEWIQEMPGSQFVFTMTEVVSQLIARGQPQVDLAEFRESIARAVGASESSSLSD